MGKFKQLHRIDRNLTPKIVPILILLFTLSGCKKDKLPQLWEVGTEVSNDHLTIKATITDYHGDFIHMSIRKANWENDYSAERSPAGNQPERDWSRVHRWFGKMHPDTYLEGRIDDGSGEGPSKITTYIFKLPLNEIMARDNFKDENGSDYEYITDGYSYADGNFSHPGFAPGKYEVEIYPWYTGRANNQHPSSNGKKGVQYVHYEQPLTSTTFIIE